MSCSWGTEVESGAISEMHINLIPVWVFMFMEDAGTMNIAPVDRMEPAPFRTLQGGSTETLSSCLG